VVVRSCSRLRGGVSDDVATVMANGVAVTFSGRHGDGGADLC